MAVSPSNCREEIGNHSSGAFDFKNLDPAAAASFAVDDSAYMVDNDMVYQDMLNEAII